VVGVVEKRKWIEDVLFTRRFVPIGKELLRALPKSVIGQRNLTWTSLFTSISIAHHLLASRLTGVA
jgi:hypothetical protein